MTVAGLLEALLKMPKDAVVLMESGGGLSLGLLCDTTSVRTLSSVQWKRGSK